MYSVYIHSRIHVYITYIIRICTVYTVMTRIAHPKVLQERSTGSLFFVATLKAMLDQRILPAKLNSSPLKSRTIPFEEMIIFKESQLEMCLA